MTQKTSTLNAAEPKLVLSSQDIERNLVRLSDRIGELQAFDVDTVRGGVTPDLKALEVAIKDTLIRCFGDNTTAYLTFQSAIGLGYYPRYVSRGERPDYVGPIGRKIKSSIALLQQAQRSLNEDLADLTHLSLPETAAPAPGPLSRKVFVVHGHDEGARESVARFLEKLGIEPVILHEQANRGRTIIEKIESHREVGFAVVLLTPDDQGCANGGTLEPRARQNVLLELGYFLGYLGRDKVCALKRGSLEIPSDFAGVVWASMNDEGWKQALSRELQGAGYEIDWNKVMRG